MYPSSSSRMLAQLSNIFLRKDNSLVSGDYERAHILTHEQGKRHGARGVEDPDPQHILSSLNRQQCSPKRTWMLRLCVHSPVWYLEGRCCTTTGGMGWMCCPQTQNPVFRSAAMCCLPYWALERVALLIFGRGRPGSGRQWYLPEGSNMNLVGYNLMTVRVSEMLGASKDLQHLNAGISDYIPRVYDAFLEVMSPPLLPRKVKVLLCRLVTSGGDLVSMEPHKAKSDRFQHLLGLARYLVKAFPPPPLPFSPTEEALKPVYNATLSETSAIVADEQQCPPHCH